jgi:hypothetical protein
MAMGARAPACLRVVSKGFGTGGCWVFAPLAAALNRVESVVDPRPPRIQFEQLPRNVRTPCVRRAGAGG